MLPIITANTFLFSTTSGNYNINEFDIVAVVMLVAREKNDLLLSLFIDTANNKKQIPKYTVMARCLTITNDNFLVQLFTISDSKLYHQKLLLEYKKHDSLIFFHV